MRPHWLADMLGATGPVGNAICPLTHFGAEHIALMRLARTAGFRGGGCGLSEKSEALGPSQRLIHLLSHRTTYVP